MDPCPAGLSVPSPEQGPGLHLGCTATASVLSRLTCRAHGKQGGMAECGPLAGRAAWPRGQECPRHPFGGAARSPAFYPAETRQGPGFPPSFPWPQEALKGTQATSCDIRLHPLLRTWPCGHRPAQLLPVLCPQSLSGFGPQQPQGSLQSSMALRRQFLPLTNACRACPTRPGGALLPSGLKSAPFCHSGLDSKSCPPRERRLLTVPSGAGAPSQYSAKVTKTQKIKTSCLPARL